VSTSSSRFLVSIHHPAQVHFFRYIIRELRADGHAVRVCVRDKEMTSELLEAFDIPHTVLAQVGGSMPGLALSQVSYETRLLREAKRFKPDVMTSVGGIAISHVAPLVGAKSLAFTDTPSMAARLLTSPFLDVVCTPVAFDGIVRGEHRRYDGYQELAYLHPNRFEPDTNRLNQFGVDPDEQLFLLRFASWQAHHDVGESGFSRRAKQTLVSILDDRGEVYITSEQPLPVEFEAYELPVPSHLIHDLLAVSDLYVGDSGTMATEAAVLGTPAIRSCSMADENDLGNFIELEERFNLLYSFVDEGRMIETAKRILANPESQSVWQKRRERLLAEKIDVTAYARTQLETLASDSKAPRTKKRKPLHS